MNLINILENESLKYPGVYRFVGRNPLKNNEQHPLYVGLAGKKAYNYFIGDKKGKEPQLLDGRLGRHLKNDAGVLGNIIDNINDLSKIEFWTVDPNEFSSEENFITALEYLEYYIKTLEGEIPYYDELQIARPPVPVEIDQETREKVIEIFEKNKKTISLAETRISDIEDHFQLMFKIFTQTPVNQLIKFRQYNKARNAFENLVSYWKLIDKSRDYHWILFETEETEQIPPTAGQAKARIEDFLVTEAPAFMGWEDWCTKYIKNDIDLFDVDASGCVNVVYMKNNQKKLARNKAVDDLILAEIEKIAADPQFNEGIIAFMYWNVDGSVIPLHVTCTESASTSNLKSNTLARWGYADARIFGDLGKSYFGNMHDKFEKWINNLFSSRPNRKLTRPVYFWAKAWNKDDFGLNGSHLHVVDFKTQLIQLKNPLFNF